MRYFRCCQDEKWKQFECHIASQIPLGRIADPDGIGKALVFLASDDASFVNGVELCVDGGMARI
jgi:NAD(P)-dependent dehydrogenase (short-subunit alcohol dehydrogenase family)